MGSRYPGLIWIFGVKNTRLDEPLRCQRCDNRVGIKAEVSDITLEKRRMMFFDPFDQARMTDNIILKN